VTTSAADKPDRVLGWDVLRGLCALSVAGYHLLYWQDVATLNTFGSYGVYLFFVLSGASLAYNYSGRLAGARDSLSFLATRWLRLAPLYIVLCGVYVAMLTARNGGLPGMLALRLALNATFAFGLNDPTVWALLIGGWSLGIEFIYYLAFPLLLLVLPRVWLCALAAIALTLVQWLWIYRTAGSAQGYAASAVAYHQVPAFAAYFFGGCIIGHWRRLAGATMRQSAGLLAWAAMGLLRFLRNPVQQGDELLGARGVVLFIACFAIVYASARVSVGARLAPVARWLGDITYGCYLLHPLYFFGFVWFVLPRYTEWDVTGLPLAVQWTIVAVVLALSCVTAAASERWFEAPVRRWGKRMLGGRRPPGPPYSEAASISS
jgi:peptidoglycan/LPS O-acetylase OafA/YrhL